MRSRPARVCIVAVGVASAFVVARDGEPALQLVRGLVVAALTVLAWVAVGRRRRTAALSAIVVGVLAVPVGVALGWPHLVKAPTHPVTFAGLAVFAGGLVLLTLGAVTAIASLHRWWWRVPVAALLVGSTVVAAWTLGQAVAATNVPPTELGPDTPGDRGLLYRDVEFPASDGVRLSGWYIPSVNGAAVVLLHGAGSTRSGVLDHAVALAGRGYGVLLYDARGHGRSGGRAMDFGWYGDEDIAGAVTFLGAQGDVDSGKIAAVGMSMGGEQAIGAAATNEALRAVVAEGATNRVASDKAWLTAEFGLRGTVQRALEWVTYELTDLLTSADQPVPLRDAVEAMAPRPVLLIAGGAVPDEARAARYFRAGSPDTVEVWEVPGTGHTDALGTHPTEWLSRVGGFLDRFVAPGAGGDDP